MWQSSRCQPGKVFERLLVLYIEHSVYDLLKTGIGWGRRRQSIWLYLSLHNAGHVPEALHEIRRATGCCACGACSLSLTGLLLSPCSLPSLPAAGLMGS